MFEIDSERTSLPLSPDRVLALVASLNAPMVVAADMPVEPTRGYICAYRDSSDRVAFSIFLHCVESGRGVFYRYDGGPMPQHRVDEVMSEAMAFAESLGFMMDDLGWGSLDAARRNELMRETPIFLEPGARAAAMATGQEGTGTSTDLAFDEATDAGVVGATPISPIQDPPAAETSGPPGSATAPGPLQTTFVPPPGAASAQAVSASAAPAGATPRSAPAGATEPLPARPAASGPHSSIEVSIDAPEPVRAPVSPGTQAVSASAAPAGATTPVPARSEPVAPPGPARPSAAAPHSSIPGATAAAQALVRLLASL